MEKKNLWMLILGMGLAWCIIACDPDGGDEFKPEDAGYWFGTYECKGANKEEITISDKNFKIKDFDESTGVATGNFIDINKISEWKKTVQLPAYENDYPYAFKITGILDGAKGYGVASIANDVHTNNSVAFYLYFNEKGDNFELVRTQVVLAEGTTTQTIPVKDTAGNTLVYQKVPAN